MLEKLDAAPSGFEDSPEHVQETDALMSSLEHESDDLWKQHRVVAIATVTLPVWASAIALAFALLWGGFALARKLVVAIMASAAAGRFIIWTGSNSDQVLDFSAWQLALLVLCLDTIWAVVLTWHAGMLFHVPWLGPRLRTAVQEGSLMLTDNRWMRRMTVIAVLAFVMMPISSTGSIGGSLLGRLLGLSRKATLASVLIGSVMGGAVMLGFAEALAPWFQNVTPAVRYGGIAVIVLMGFVLSRRYRRSIAE
jgi:uncharacterized membrane protein